MLKNGIGINTGVALVGNIGAEGKKMDYTMIGDQVNLAARFQGLTRMLGHPILLTEFTASKLAFGLGSRNAGCATAWTRTRSSSESFMWSPSKDGKRRWEPTQWHVQTESARSMRNAKPAQAEEKMRGSGNLAGFRTRLGDLVDFFFGKDIHEFRI